MLDIQTPMEHFENELAEEVRLFSLTEDMRVVHEVRQEEQQNLHRVTVTRGTQSRSAEQIGARCAMNDLERKRMDKRAAKLATYQALCALTGERQPWGSLTGVRPTKLLAELCQQGRETDFVDFYDVQPEKYELARQILDVQARAMHNVPA